MVARLDIRVQDQEVSRLLNRALRRSQDLTPAMRKVSGVLASAVDDAFELMRDPLTLNRWPDLTATTKSLRRQPRSRRGRTIPSSGPPYRILIDTAILVNSFTTEHGKDFALVGTNVKYAPTHQYGAAKGKFGSDRYGRSIPWGNVPARPFLGVTEDDLEEIRDILRRYILGD